MPHPARYRSSDACTPAARAPRVAAHAAPVGLTPAACLSLKGRAQARERVCVLAAAGRGARGHHASVEDHVTEGTLPSDRQGSCLRLGRRRLRHARRLGGGLDAIWLQVEEAERSRLLVVLDQHTLVQPEEPVASPVIRPATRHRPRARTHPLQLDANGGTAVGGTCRAIGARARWRWLGCAPNAQDLVAGGAVRMVSEQPTATQIGVLRTRGESASRKRGREGAPARKRSRRVQRAALEAQHCVPSRGTIVVQQQLAAEVGKLVDSSVAGLQGRECMLEERRAAQRLPVAARQEGRVVALGESQLACAWVERDELREANEDKLVVAQGGPPARAERRPHECVALADLIALERPQSVLARPLVEGQDALAAEVRERHVREVGSQATRGGAQRAGG